MSTTAIVQYSKDHKRISVLCPSGHLVETHKLDPSFGGSRLEADISDYDRGKADCRFNRVAARCCKTEPNETSVYMVAAFTDDEEHRLFVRGANSPEAAERMVRSRLEDSDKFSYYTEHYK